MSIRLFNSFIGPISAREVLEELHLPPDEGGVYLWRRTLSIDESAYGNQDIFMAWINRLASRQYFGSVNLAVETEKSGEKITIRDGFVRVKGLEVGGGEIKRQNGETLRTLAENKEIRRQMIDVFFDAGNRFGPIVYVGQSKSLRNRINEHLLGQTELLPRLNKLGMTVDDIALHYLKLPSFDDRERCAIEAFITNLSVSPLVMRDG